MKQHSIHSKKKHSVSEPNEQALRQHKEEILMLSYVTLEHLLKIGEKIVILKAGMLKYSY